MSTSQSSKNKFISNESIHNVISLCYFILITLVVLLVLVVSVVIKNNLIILASSISLFFLILKLIIQIKTIIKFNKLKNTVDNNESIHFYITKSWLRKKQSTIYLTVELFYLNTIFIIISIILKSLNNNNDFFSLIILSTSFFVILITSYTNNQIIDGYLKLSRKRIDFSSIELIQIKKEQKIFYKTILYWVISLTLIVPIVLMMFPKYREFIRKKISE